MTEATWKKPFYMHPPWNILFEIHKLEKVAPWNINIAYLLTSFLEEMEKAGYVDFRASGVALDSSAFIYLLKSELLLKLEEPPTPPRHLQDFVPPPLFLPLRYELTSTTLQHLLEVLDEVLKSEKLIPPEPAEAKPVLPTPSDVLPQFEIYLMEIELQMDKLYNKLLEMVKGSGIIEFSALIKGAEKLEAIRKFILLLFLAQDGKIGLWQDEELEEIYITVGEFRNVENKTERV